VVDNAIYCLLMSLSVSEIFMMMIVFIKAINRHTTVKHNAEHTDMLKNN